MHTRVRPRTLVTLFEYTLSFLCHQLFDLLILISGLCVVGFRMSLDKKHGFLKGIRRHLQQQADELGLMPWDNSHQTTSSSDEPSIAATSQLPPGIIINNT